LIVPRTCRPDCKLASTYYWLDLPPDTKTAAKGAALVHNLYTNPPDFRPFQDVAGARIRPIQKVAKQTHTTRNVTISSSN
jgi:hypothetical protein